MVEVSGGDRIRLRAYCVDRGTMKLAATFAQQYGDVIAKMSARYRDVRLPVSVEVCHRDGGFPVGADRIGCRRLESAVSVPGKNLHAARNSCDRLLTAVCYSDVQLSITIEIRYRNGIAIGTAACTRNIDRRLKR